MQIFGRLGGDDFQSQSHTTRQSTGSSLFLALVGWGRHFRGSGPMTANTPRWFRVTCVLPFAAIPAKADTIPPLMDTAPSTVLSDRARLSINRVSRRDVDIREAMFALYDGLVHLERELEEMRRNMRLTAAGVELRPELIHIGGDGLTLQRPLAWRVGDAVHLYVSLAIRDSACLMGIPATVARGEEGHTELVFGAMTPEQRDRIVAFTFQQQGRERRRVLDSVSSVD